MGPVPCSTARWLRQLGDESFRRYQRKKTPSWWNWHTRRFEKPRPTRVWGCTSLRSVVVTALRPAKLDSVQLRSTPPDGTGGNHEKEEKTKVR